MAQFKVLDVGNCSPDFSSIRTMLTSNFDVEVLQAHQAKDALDSLETKNVDLVLINRKLDCDYSDGTEVLKQIKADESLRQIPVMIVTNYEEHQDAAIKLGAVRGFGKLQLDNPKTLSNLSKYLS